MIYLFFDLEFASSQNGHKICEFGYTVTNEKFKVIEKNNLIIDPNIRGNEWDWYALKKILTRKRGEYEAGKRFSFYYPKIISLIKNADMIFGHTTSGDVAALNEEFYRYSLPGIDFNFYDITKYYMYYTEAETALSLTSMLDELEIDGSENAHDAEYDAFNTMQVLRELLVKMNISLSELMERCNDAFDYTKNSVIKSHLESLIKAEERFLSELNGDGTNSIADSRLNKRRYLQYLDNLSPAEPVGTALQGLKIAISVNYEAQHFRQVISLAQRIADAGGEITRKVSESNVFVKYPLNDENGEPIEDKGYTFIENFPTEENNIKVIGLDELLEMLGISERELDAVPLPSFEFLLYDDAVIADKKDMKTIEKIREKRRIYKELKAEI